MKVAPVIVFLSGLGFALHTASCASKSACSASAGAGGASGAAGSAGSAGSGGSSDCSPSAGSAGAATTCAYLSALQACFGAFCKADGVGTPVCTCYTRGYDLDAAPGCGCIPVNSVALCQQAVDRGLDGSSVDCAVVTSAVATQCVGVQ